MRTVASARILVFISSSWTREAARKRRSLAFDTGRTCRPESRRGRSRPPGSHASLQACAIDHTVVAGRHCPESTRTDAGRARLDAASDNEAAWPVGGLPSAGARHAPAGRVLDSGANHFGRRRVCVHVGRPMFGSLHPDNRPQAQAFRLGPIEQVKLTTTLCPGWEVSRAGVRGFGACPPGGVAWLWGGVNQIQREGQRCGDEEVPGHCAANRVEAGADLREQGFLGGPRE